MSAQEYSLVVASGSFHPLLGLGNEKHRIGPVIDGLDKNRTCFVDLAKNLCKSQSFNPLKLLLFSSLIRGGRKLLFLSTLRAFLSASAFHAERIVDKSRKCFGHTFRGWLASLVNFPSVSHRD